MSADYEYEYRVIVIDKDAKEAHTLQTLRNDGWEKYGWEASGDFIVYELRRKRIPD